MSLKGSCLLTAMLVVGLCAGSYAESPADLFTINLSREVIVGDKILPAGLWEIRWQDQGPNPMLTIYRDNAINAEVGTVSIRSEDDKKRKTTEGVIEKIGPEYYLTSIWVKGQRTGYKIVLSPEVANLQREDMQRLQADFVSGSRFSQGALMEGQARTHQAQGLGGPDGRLQTGVVLARTYYPTPPQSEAVAAIVPEALPTTEEVAEVFPSELQPFPTEPALSEPGQEPLSALSNQDSNGQASPQIVEEAPAVTQSAQVEPPEALPAVEPLSAEAEQPQDDNTAAQQVQAEPDSNLSDLSAIEESGSPESQDTVVFDGELPATASNWLGICLIGLALVGLSFAVRWG